VRRKRVLLLSRVTCAAQTPADTGILLSQQHAIARRRTKQESETEAAALRIELSKALDAEWHMLRCHRDVLVQHGYQGDGSVKSRAPHPSVAVGQLSRKLAFSELWTGERAVALPGKISVTAAAIPTFFDVFAFQYSQMVLDFLSVVVPIFDK
jgi:hypothetical protein